MDQQQKPNIDVQFSKEDQVKCKCGCEIFAQKCGLAKKNNPVIGQPPLVAVMPSGFFCLKCGCDPFMEKQEEQPESSK